MFTISNPPLEAAIRSSVVLQQKLTVQQLEKFVEQALHLPPNGQAELLKKLEEEAIVLAQHAQKARLAVKMYDGIVQQKTNALVQKIYKDAENEEQKNLSLS